MGFRDTNRFEFFRQPHVIVIGLLLFAICAGAIYTGVRRVQQMQTASNSATFDACKQFVEDELLCKFAGANEAAGSKNYKIASTTTNGESTEITTTEVEHADRMKSVSLNGPQVTESYVIIDATTYVKDFTDNTWAKYTDPDFTPSQDSITYDFTNATSEDVIEFRDRYKNDGTESCGDLTCHKYEVQYPDSETVTYLWFDTEEFMLRRFLATEGDITTNSQFSYGPVSIQAPTPTKDVTAEEVEAYL